MSINSIKKLAIRGTIWTIAGYGVSQILRLGNHLILTRLFVLKLFSLMTLVSPLAESQTISEELMQKQQLTLRMIQLIYLKLPYTLLLSEKSAEIT